MLLFLAGLLFCWAGATGQESAPERAASGVKASEKFVLPVGSILQIRLRQSLSSYVSKAGTPIRADVIAPVVLDGRTVLPMRTELYGYVREARKVGLGFSRESALLHLEFDRMVIPGVGERPLQGKVKQLDDARERVDAQGRIRGIRATDSFSSMLSGFAVSAAAFDPLALAFSLSSSLSIFRVPDSSVVLPAGAELHFEVGAEMETSGGFGRQYPELQLGESAQKDLEETVRKLPFRTATQSDGTPSDLTSLLYLGSQAAIERAFRAAGWVRADRLDGQSTYGVMRSIIENQGYRAAPMSVLLLNRKEPELAFAKTLNTFFSRHHLRIYGQEAQVAGQGVWTSTATYDSGIGFARAAKTFIHLINENIDEERSKVVNDLVLTGCVDGVSYIERPWVPRDAKNATGDTLRTDGRIAVLQMNECGEAQRADAVEEQKDPNRMRQSAYLRPLRTAFLTLRHDLIRGNLAYQGFQGFRMVKNVMGKAPAENGQPRSFQVGGQEFLVVEGARPVKHPAVPKDAGWSAEKELAKRRPKSYANRLLFSFNSGLSGYGPNRSSVQPFTLVVRNPAGIEFRDPLDLSTSLERGWTISPKLTLNTWKHISHEFSYSRTSTNFRMAGEDQILGTKFDERSKAVIRRFTYNTLFHLRPNGKRIRPYLAAGPAVQLIHLLEATPKENSLLKFAARDVALFVTAYDFGRRPPLEGGGVFQLGADYGGGASFHLTPRFFLRADYRETLSAHPDFWKSSPKSLQEQFVGENLRLEYGALRKSGPLRHQLVTIGIGVSF